LFRHGDVLLSEDAPGVAFAVGAFPPADPARNVEYPEDNADCYSYGNRVGDGGGVDAL